MRRILKELGFEQVYVVPEQEIPDGDFPTVNYPNPEDSNAFSMAIKLAKEVDADVILATDPDADRWESMQRTTIAGNMYLLLEICRNDYPGVYLITEKRKL